MPRKENALAGTRAINTTSYTRKYKRFPPYGKKLMSLRIAGKIPRRMVVVVFDWKLARAWPRIVIPDDMSYEGLNFDYLSGLPVEIAHRSKDTHKVEPAFTAAALRNLIFKAETRHSSKGEIPSNGLIECGAIIRCGRKVMIHRERFLEWVQSR